MAAIARYVRIAAFAAMLQVHFPFWHHLLEMIRINMHDIFQREDSISRHPGQCKTFTHTHGATSENEPRTMLLGCSLNNCGKHTVLPNLAIDCVTAMVCVVTCSLSEQLLSTYCTPQSWEASTVSRSGKSTVKLPMYMACSIPVCLFNKQPKLFWAPFISLPTVDRGQPGTAFKQRDDRKQKRDKICQAM